MQETWVQSAGWDDPLEKEMATHSSILAWEVPWTWSPGDYHLWNHRVVHDLMTKQQQHMVFFFKKTYGLYLQKEVNSSVHGVLSARILE